MVESVIAGGLAGLLVAILGHFLLHWGLRRSIRQLAEDWADLQERLAREAKKRASAAGVVARSAGVQPADLAALQRGGAEPQPWWSSLVPSGKMKDGPDHP